jgi:arylsulfatase A
MSKTLLNTLIKSLIYTLALSSGNSFAADDKPQPNVIIIFADDMGYGDMSNNGHPTLKTPNLDQMAMEGQKWTNFYVAAPVCSPSRAGLMLGKYPVRAGLASSTPFRQVFREDSLGGMPDSELTIPEALKQQGYSTAMIGKWHIGHLPEYLPNHHGFDSWFGIPYSNDMDQDFEKIQQANGPQWSPKTWNKGVQWTNPKSEYFRVPLMQGVEIVEYAPNQHELTKIYTEKAQTFIKQNSKKPFFLYLAHAMPHVPLFASKEFEGKSTQGLYGDVMEELDWSVGQVLQTLKDQGIADNTLVIFSSDNGPWTWFETLGGSPGLLRGGKSDVFEGGMRVPGIFWWPGHVKPDIRHDIGSTIDLLPTLVDLAGGKVPMDTDGFSLKETLLQGQPAKRDEYFYYRGARVFAVRKGQYKAHFIFKEGYGGSPGDVLEKPLLFDLNADPSEKYDIAETHPEIVAQLTTLRNKHIASVIPVENQLDKCKKGSRLCQ